MFQVVWELNCVTVKEIRSIIIKQTLELGSGGNMSPGSSRSYWTGFLCNMNIVTPHKDFLFFFPAFKAKGTNSVFDFSSSSLGPIVAHGVRPSVLKLWH